MSNIDDISSIDSLSIPKRQKVFDKTFLPAGDTQPVWANIPLDQKIPVCPSPRGAFTFYTNKVGEPKYINHQRLDFDLTNPQGREAPQEYDSLQDPALRTYFTSPRTKRHLVDNGLITHRGEIVCNVKEFNEYRAFFRYRSVTELSLMKKQEKRFVQEEKDQVFLDWPSHVLPQNTHKKRRGRDKRHVYSEPPRRSEPVSGLDAYKEDLSAGLRRTEKHRRADELRRSGKTPVDTPYSSPRRREPSAYDLSSPRRQTPSMTPSPRKPSGLGQVSPRRGGSENSVTESHLFGGQKLSLVEEMRRREQLLKSRQEEQRRSKEEEHRRRLEDNWRERQTRQEKLLSHEAEVEAKTKEERNVHIMQREKTLTQQRTHQDAQLQKIRHDMGKGRQTNTTISNYKKSSRKNSHKGSNEDVSRKDPSDDYQDDFVALPQVN